MKWAEAIGIVTSFLGMYSILTSVWQHFEELELGYTVVTTTDSVICAIISIVAVIWIYLNM